jgi:pSer/pThr/pTyr-binding forkhead associated (FHA) protein
MASTSSIRVAYPQAALVSTGQPTVVVIPLDRPLTLVGSGDIAHLRLHSRHVDAVHAVVLNVDGRILVRDLASREGVVVNGSRVGLTVIEDGDEVTFGRTSFTLERGDAVHAAVDQPSPEAELCNDRWRLTLSAPICLIGSGPGCDAPLPAEAVAPKHALACAADGGWMLRGLEPNNFPRLNGRAKRRLRLPPGARVGIGAVELTFVVHRDAAETTATTTTPTTTTASTTTASTTTTPATTVTTQVAPQLSGQSVQDVQAVPENVAPPTMTTTAVEAARYDDAPPARSDVETGRDEPSPLNETGVPPADLALTPSDLEVACDDLFPPADSAPAPTVTPVATPEGAAVAAIPIEPTANVIRAATDDRGARPAAAVEPVAEEDSPEDSGDSKVGINYEAIRAWGPLAAAVAGVGGRAEAPAKPPPPTESAGARRWVLTGAALAVLIIGAVVGWFVFRG